MRSPFDSTAPTFPPKFLESYRVIALIGEGGMGVVYRARQLALDREVAVKVLKSGGGDDEARFLREGRLLAELACPQIVRVLDADADAGRLWLVFELVTGESVHDRQVRSPLPIGQVLEVLLEVCRALELAHSRGIVHRDVKPENVIVAADGAVKLADFGLARHVQSGEALTSSGIVLGTPHYIAPEQVRGLPAEPASDQYALGVMLFWLTTGVHPIDGNNPLEIMMRKCSVVAPLAHRTNDAVPRAVSAVAERALAIEPGDRYPSVSELATDLERVRLALSRPARRTRLAPAPVLPASPASPASRATRGTPSIAPAPSRWMAVIAGVMLGAVLVLGIRLAMDARRIVSERERLAAIRPATVTASDITFRRIGGESCLEIRVPELTAMRVDLETPSGKVPLPPVAFGAEARRFRVLPEQVAAAVRLEVTAAEGAPVTTSVTWHGLAGQLAEQGELLARARHLLATERLLERPLDEVRRELPRLRETWARIGRPLFELGPVLLDLPDFPLERKREIHEALTSLRVLDRIARGRGLAAVVPPDLYGRALAVGLRHGAAVKRERIFDSSRTMRVSPPPDQLLELADPRSEALPSLLLRPPRLPHRERVILELETGPLAQGDMLWVDLGSWRMLAMDDAHAMIPAYEKQREYVYLGVEPRLIGAAGLKLSLSYQILPGGMARSVIPTVDRAALYYLEGP